VREGVLEENPPEVLEMVHVKEVGCDDCRVVVNGTETVTATVKEDGVTASKTIKRSRVSENVGSH